jgi:C-terminal processing protease CtpA/Prc
VPTIGLIGADALLNFRIGLDYAHSTIYFKQLSKYTPPGIDVVGVTLKPEEDGRYTIIGVAEHGGKSSVPDVKVGDTLMTVDNARVKGGTMGQAWSLLSGTPGDARSLGLIRDGKPLTVKATVVRFLPAVKAASKSQKH